MGQSTDAILAYGYDLGGEEEWKLQEAGEYGELPELPWYSEDDEDFQGDAEAHLLKVIAGFTETWSRENEGYRERERAAKERLGVQIDTHCSGNYPMYLLAAKIITASRGDAKDIDLASLTSQPVSEDWDEKLRAALQALGITPNQDKAKWLLCSYWG